MHTKKIIGLILIAAMFSGIISSGLSVWWLRQEAPPKFQVEHIDNTPAVGALYTTDADGDIIPLDFSKVADKVMATVVHIKSTQVGNTNPYVQDNNRSPDIFRDEFFKDFFGPRFYYRENPPNQRPRAKVGTGSGVIITSDGYIVTNNHVIQDSDDIEVTLHDNRTYKARVIGTDPSTDLALIQIKEKDLPYVPFSNSDEAKVGEWVMAVGNPFNLNSTVTVGIVSAKARNINILKDQAAIESFIQTDAAINPGNSGGALVNLQGGLIGINTAIASPTGAYAGYGFAVPSNIVEKVIEDLKNYGIVQRGYLGVMIRSVDGNLAKEKDLDVISGVYVDSLLANSSASNAGIKVGDVILEVDEIAIKTAPELQELIGRHRPGDMVKVKINRSGKEKTIDVKLNNKDGSAKLIAKENREILSLLGADLEDLDKDLAKKLEISGGVYVRKLYPGLLRKHTQMQEEFIITHIDSQKVDSVEELTKLLEKKKGGVMIEGVYEELPGTYYYAFGL